MNYEARHQAMVWFPGIPRVGAGFVASLGNHGEDVDPGPGLLRFAFFSFSHTRSTYTSRTFLYIHDYICFMHVYIYIYIHTYLDINASVYTAHVYEAPFQ